MKNLWHKLQKLWPSDASQTAFFSKTIHLTFLGLVLLVVWAYWAEVDEVASSTGKVIPSGKEQTIQSLEGGIISSIHVREGEEVQAGQVLVKLDPVRTSAAVEESAAKVNALEATAARLKAEVSGSPLIFPPELDQEKELKAAETNLYHSRKGSLTSTLASVSDALALVRQEIAMTEPLVSKGAASQVEVLRLKRQENDLVQKLNDTESQYVVKAREELAKVSTELEAQKSVARGREDALNRLEIKSPVRGIVKNVEVTTVGGVIPPNGRLMAIVPLDGQLLVEARVSPRDIAFIRMQQQATVKVTAYDYSIYGALPGEVVMVSPDSVQDEVKRDNYYYRVYIRTDKDYLVNKAGTSFPISPGMVAVVDIHTGSKTIFDYIVKPFNKLREALRER
ncbi:MAG TPA: HlyD family efflux transporter periplasmic adaptor subunit [Candidatus Avacidaminococcus intestinavium]|uniref:HlyD family efflux transporter periplasmic adaptor subunit n=1 Tax=Candidatus Avacidaminococcus intestinavium TaxID=2840684 RepID=A0A9D1MPP7_9FIRM|nr:HlyD family efflux transporter periplasmic adaptor subunit [Candidatus Avacidaminococcus intestinavium]